ncbi:hypothetical protein ACN28I_28150 [Archangium gephyra]|uniref:hypothetical protein n=1 Tax=Archangium gephyra TaxID=48 RepID=UPI003B79EB7D
MHAPHRLSEAPRTRALLPAVLAGLLLLGGTGCATNKRQHLLERSAAYAAYRLPPEQILETARELLKERGYLILASTDPHYVRTDWRTKFDETLDVGGVRERHMVMGKQLADGRFILNVYRITYTTVGRTAPHPAAFQSKDASGVQKMIKGDPLSYARPVLVRDLELEWQILSRVSPSIARELETQVDEYLTPESN